MSKMISVLGTILLLLVLFQPAAAAPAGAAIIGYHVVQAGETLFCIARAYSVDPWAIAAQNGIINPNLIQPGASLAIPAVYTTPSAGRTCSRQFGGAPAASCSCVTRYTIVSGDTLTRISAIYGVSSWRIAQCNNIYNLNVIRAGDSLCIPGP